MQPQVEVINLHCGQSIADITSTRRMIHGPKTVTYTKYEDGGVDQKVEPWLDGACTDPDCENPICLAAYAS